MPGARPRPLSLPLSKLQSSATGSSAASQLSFTSFRTETDLTTPSLCSDTEQDGDPSLDDRPPATPPMAAMSRSRSNSRDVSRERTAPPNIGGPSMRSTEFSGRKPVMEGVRNKSIPLDAADRSNVFLRRPPSSPMPHDSPRRPRPPASKKSKTSPTHRGGDSDDDLPRKLSYSSRKEGKAPRVVSSSPTLDQELRRALDAEMELESDTYTGCWHTEYEGRIYCPWRSGRCSCFDWTWKLGGVWIRATLDSSTKHVDDLRRRLRGRLECEQNGIFCYPLA